MRFKAKIDWWIKLLMYFSVLMLVPLIFTVPKDEMWIMGLITLLMALTILPFVILAYYELREDHLYIRMGIIFYRIKYEKIQKVWPCENFASSFALSKERVGIQEHNKSSVRGRTYVSPEDREMFLHELKRNCKNLEEKSI